MSGSLEIGLRDVDLRSRTNLSECYSRQDLLRMTVLKHLSIRFVTLLYLLYPPPPQQSMNTCTNCQTIKKQEHLELLQHKVGNLSKAIFG